MHGRSQAAHTDGFSSASFSFYLHMYSCARYLACSQKFLPVRELKPTREPDVKFRESYRPVRERPTWDGTYISRGGIPYSSQTLVFLGPLEGNIGIMCILSTNPRNFAYGLDILGVILEIDEAVLAYLWCRFESSSSWQRRRIALRNQ